MFFGIGPIPFWLAWLPLLLGKAALSREKRRQERNERIYEYAVKKSEESAPWAPLPIAGKVYFGLFWAFIIFIWVYLIFS